jgi:hypothetical protein
LVASRGRKQREVNREIAIEDKKKGKRKRLLLNGSLLWREVVLLSGLFSFVRHGLGVFSGEGGRKDVK